MRLRFEARPASLIVKVCVCVCVYHSKQRPIKEEENIYGNWMDTMTTICDDITTESQVILINVSVEPINSYWIIGGLLLPELKSSVIGYNQ